MIKKKFLYLLNLKEKYKIFKKFEKFNKKIFYKRKSKNIILIEFNSFHSSHFFFRLYFKLFSKEIFWKCNKLL